MPTTLFYSWQADLPPEVTRDFIREALEVAVDAVNKDIAIEEVLRVTSDTQDEPGHPPIFETILAKIDASAVFVPDVSIVTQIDGDKPNNEKGLFNPNVAIEYGYALKALGQERMVPVMNTAFGGLKKLPFDMAHRRGPVRFHLPPNPSQEQIAKEKDALIEGLVHALTVMREHNLLTGTEALGNEITEFQTVAPYEGLEANRLPVALLGRVNLDAALDEGDTMVWLRNGPSMFLRLIPNQEYPPFEPLDLKDMMKQASLWDLMGYRTNGAFYWQRNQMGAAAFTVDLNAQRDNNAFAFGLTQVFTNGEIWGVDTWLLDPERSKRHVKENWPHIGSFTLEEGMITALSQYLRFARDHLQLSPPLRWVAGIRDIREHRLALDREYSELPYEDEKSESGLIHEYTSPIHKILEPFFEAIWREFGVRRPPSESERWEQATGFDLEG